MLPFGKCRGGLSPHEAGLQVRLAEELALVGAVGAAVASLATAAVLAIYGPFRRVFRSFC